MTFDKVFAGLLLTLLLGGFFLWVLLEMASASESMWRLSKLGIGMGAVVVAAPLVYLLLTPLHRRRRR